MRHRFTAAAFFGVLREQGIRISMDGRGARRDNMLVERLWKSIKYEEVYLHAYQSQSDAKSGISSYVSFYNTAVHIGRLTGGRRMPCTFNPCRSRQQPESRSSPDPDRENCLEKRVPF